MGISPFEPLFEREGVSVSRSPWGPGDNIGRLNLMTAQSRQAVLSRADARRVYDLAVDYFLGMPSWAAAGDPTYQMWMTHTPGGSMNDRPSGATPEVHEKYSYCGDSIEVLNLEELSRSEIFEIAFIGMPLKLRGGTGSPIRPIGMPLLT